MLHNYSTIGLISNRKIQYILEAPISHRKKIQKKNTTHHPRRRNTWHSITVRTAIFLCKYRSFANPHRWYGRIWFDSLYWAANVVRNPMLISKSRGHIPVWRVGHMNATTWTLCYIHTYIHTYRQSRSPLDPVSSSIKSHHAEREPLVRIGGKREVASEVKSVKIGCLVL